MSEERAERSARDRAIDALARREHSARELEQKLARKGLAADAISEALVDLAAEGLQDDSRYAEAYARARAARGYGPRRITAELRERGVDAARIAIALDQDELDWYTFAVEVRRKKFGGSPKTMTERARQTRFLEYRGYLGEQIRHAFGQAEDDEDI